MSLGRFAAGLERLRALDLYRSRIVLEGPQGPRITVDGKRYLAFCSNDYLGLAYDARIARAAAAAIERYGLGSGASHLVTGHSEAHERLEEALARFVDLPRALLFSNGYLANIGVITALTEGDDVIFSDALNHASMIDGSRLSRAKVVKVPHADPEALERAIRENPARSRFVVTESVFSMDGDLAPLPAILEVCERHDAWLIVDDAHGFGVLGRSGRGALEHFGLRSPRIAYVGTLGKAAGVSGAFVAGPQALVETVLQRARSYIYTTASPPFLAAALEESLRIIAGESWRREHLRELIGVVREGMKDRLAASDTPIQPLILGESRAALEASAALRERGIIVTAIRPPTVPEGSARLRLSLSAAHETQDVRSLVAVLREILAS